MKIDEFLETKIWDKRDRRMMYVAYGAALASPGVGPNNNFRLGAVLVDGPRVVSVGFNSYKTHPKLITYTEYPYLHAEQAAIFKHGMENCEGLDLYVIRVLRDGRAAISDPCPVCKQLIEDVGIGGVYFVDGYGYFVVGRS